MMDWIPEHYPRAGGLAAAGFYKLLGRPRLDPLTVLVRETAQNSWDARDDKSSPVLFSIAGWHLEDSERGALQKEVFTRADQARGTGLADELASPGLTGIYICDRNTKGLGGPFNADQADKDDIYDWVDFVLNVGKANTAGQTGGTYGFGKTISYVVSSANAVVIHSRTRYNGRLQTRFIACAIGDEFKAGGRLFTGRHWWGRNEEGSPQPVTGPDATRLARLVGMPEFHGDETGTNILIVAPDLGGRTPEQAMTFIAESVTWHLWPKLMKRVKRPQPMIISVSWNGSDLEIPRPEDRPPLHGFAQAFQAMLEGASSDETPIGTKLEDLRCQRPSTVVGQLVTVPLVHRDRAVVHDGHDPADHESPAPAAAILGPCHHVALLRTPELVIEYLEGPAPPEGGTEWAGVFRARDQHDGHFAAAEPPTHDSWNPSLLPKSQGRTIVNVGLREIRVALERRWAQRSRAHAQATLSTAFIADELAHIVRTVDAKGPGRRRRDPTGGGHRHRAAKVDVVHTGPVIYYDRIATVAKLRVTPATGNGPTRLHFSVGAALDGSSSDKDLDPDLSLIEARYQGLVQSLEGLNERIDLADGGPVEIELVVARGPETTVLFDIQAETI